MVTAEARGTLAANIVMPILAIIATVLRIVSRRVKSQPLLSDDWLILLALVLAIGVAANGIYAACTGLFGIEFQYMTLATYQRFRKVIFADEIVVNFILGFVKLSVLLFYKRIFSAAPRFRLAANILLFCVGAWTISAFLGFLCGSRGVSSFWTTPPQDDLTEYTIDFGAFQNAIAGIDLALDVMILSLPIPVIKQLHMTGDRKVSLAAVFMLGAFCVVCSSVRLYYIHALLHFSGSNYHRRTFLSDANDLWGHVESCASIIAACLPTMGPLFSQRSPESLIGSVRSAISLRSGSVFGGSRQRETSTTDSQSTAAKKAWIELNAADRTTTSVVGADLESQKTANGKGISVERSFHSRETAT